MFPICITTSLLHLRTWVAVPGLLGLAGCGDLTSVLLGEWTGVLRDQDTGEEFTLEWDVVRVISEDPPGVQRHHVVGRIPEIEQDYESVSLLVCLRTRCPTLDEATEVPWSVEEEAHRGSLRHEALWSGGMDHVGSLVLAAEPEDGFERYVGTFLLQRSSLPSSWSSGAAELHRR